MAAEESEGIVLKRDDGRLAIIVKIQNSHQPAGTVYAEPHFASDAATMSGSRLWSAATS